MIRVVSARMLQLGRRAGLVTMALSAALATSVALAAEGGAPRKADLAKGGSIAQAQCASCHGADGNTPGNAYPKLAGQHADYLAKQLQNFQVKQGAKGPERVNAVMNGMAAARSADDVRNGSAYFVSQALKPAVAKNLALAETGQRIYRGGIAEKNVPACAGCHSPNGAGIPAQYPRLGGQWAEYTEAQLVAFRSGARANNPVMTTVASRLSDNEIKAVSDYMAGLR